MKAEMANPSCLVTGAGARIGIGKAIVDRLIAKGYRVFAGVRDIRLVSSFCNSAAIPVELDVTSDADVAQAASLISQTVGAQRPPGLGELGRDHS